MKTEKITFEDLVRESPELENIKRDAIGIWNSNFRWEKYEKLKGRMNRLVGWSKLVPKNMPDFMYTSDAHDIAWNEIFKSGYEKYLSEYENESE